MGDLGSDAWLDGLARRLSPLVVDSPIALGVVIDAADRAVEYQVRLGPAGAVVERSPVRQADVTLVLDEHSARRLADGTATAQELLFDGHLRLRGDIGSLRGLGSTLEAAMAGGATSDASLGDEVSR